MWKFLGVVVVVVVVACGGSPRPLPPPPEQSLSVSVTGSMFETANGYRLAVMPSATSRIVRLDVRYPVGHIDDPPGKAGLAHLVEHLLFSMELERDGAKTSVGAELDRVALYSNAETTYEYTDYTTVARPEALDDLVALEVARLDKGCSGITPAIFQHQREIVLAELRMRQGAGGGALLRTVLASIYPASHPYLEHGSVESVAALDFKDVCDFLAGPYRRALQGASEVHGDHIVYAQRDLAMHVDQMVQLLSKKLRFTEYKLSDQVRSELAAELGTRSMKEYVAFAQQLQTAVFGASHPYAHPPMSRASIDALAKADSASWARKYIVPANATLVIIGQIDPDAVRAYIEHDVADLAPGTAATPLTAPPIARSHVQHVTGVTSTPTPTLALELAFRAGNGIDRDYAMRLVLERVLDEKLRGLREKQALSYGFAASYTPRRVG